MRRTQVSCLSASAKLSKIRQCHTSEDFPSQQNTAMALLMDKLRFEGVPEDSPYYAAVAFSSRPW
jgi:hypothetical protein